LLVVIHELACSLQVGSVSQKAISFTPGFSQVITAGALI